MDCGKHSCIMYSQDVGVSAAVMNCVHSWCSGYDHEAQRVVLNKKHASLLSLSHIPTRCICCWHIHESWISKRAFMINCVAFNDVFRLLISKYLHILRQQLTSFSRVAGQVLLFDLSCACTSFSHVCMLIWPNCVCYVSIIMYVWTHWIWQLNLKAFNYHWAKVA